MVNGKQNKKSKIITEKPPTNKLENLADLTRLACVLFLDIGAPLRQIQVCLTDYTKKYGNFQGFVKFGFASEVAV